MLASLATAPAAANQTIRWTDTHDIDATYTCGVVEDTTATIEGTAYFAADGTCIKDIVRFKYAATFTDPISGRTIEFTTRQVVEGSPDSLTFRGQGLFIRVAAIGAELLDIGRLAIDPSDGSTLFASAHVLTSDDPALGERIDSAVRGMF